MNEGARIEFHLKNESNEVAMVGDKIRRNPIVKDEFPLEGTITEITLNNPARGTEAGIVLDNMYSIPLMQVGDFSLVYTDSKQNTKGSSVNDLLNRASGTKSYGNTYEEANNIVRNNFTHE